MRQATLEATRHDLKLQQKSCTESTEKMRASLQQYKKQKTDEILSLNNTISQLKKRLEEMEAEVFVLESKKDYTLQDASRRTLEFG